MKFILTEESWILTELDPIEWTFLHRIPEMAAGENLPPQFRSRLLPDPIHVPDSERKDEEGFLEDWKEFVRPDLESAFISARDQVSQDLALAQFGDSLSKVTGSPSVEEDEEEHPYAVENEEGEDDDLDEDGPEFAPRSEGVPDQVEVARDSSEAWYSAINQARLLMNEAHDLADASERFQWPDPNEEEPQSTPQTPPIDGARLLLMAQYEFYTALQSILLEVMTRNDRSFLEQEKRDDADDIESDDDPFEPPL